MIEVRCKLCNTELKSHPTQTRCCGCTNMMTVVGDKVSVRAHNWYIYRVVVCCVVSLMEVVRCA